MIPEQSVLQEKFSALLGWEKIKRRERILVSAFCYAVIASLIVLPAARLLPVWADPGATPLLFFLIVAPILFFRDRWNEKESTRAVSLLDKTLHLDARAITAWEMMARAEFKPTELLVLHQTGQKLRGVEPQALFERRLSWHAYLILPLLLLWVGLLRFELGSPVGDAVHGSAPKSVAQKLREFSRELQEKAKTAGLSESLQVAREMEKVAQRRLGGETGEEPFREDLAALATKMEAMGRSAPTGSTFLSAAESQSGLEALKAELEAMKDKLSFPDDSQPGRGFGQRLAESLGALPRLKREIEQRLPSADKLNENELRTFLDRLERDVTGEQDRRTVLEAQQFLESLLQQGKGQPGASGIRVARPGQPDVPAQAEEEKGNASRPGDEPGRKEASRQPLPGFGAGAATHLKGLLREGKSGGAALRGKPAGGDSEVAQDEVIVSYSRQAEAELNSERIPHELKEAIKRYFLSLGMGQEQK